MINQYSKIYNIINIVAHGFNNSFNSFYPIDISCKLSVGFFKAYTEQNPDKH